MQSCPRTLNEQHVFQKIGRVPVCAACGIIDTSPIISVYRELNKDGTVSEFGSDKENVVADWPIDVPVAHSYDYLTPEEIAAAASGVFAPPPPI